MTAPYIVSSVVELNTRLTFGSHKEEAHAMFRNIQAQQLLEPILK